MQQNSNLCPSFEIAKTVNLHFEEPLKSPIKPPWHPRCFGNLEQHGHIPGDLGHF